MCYLLDLIVSLIFKKFQPEFSGSSRSHVKLVSLFTSVAA